MKTTLHAVADYDKPDMAEAARRFDPTHPQHRWEDEHQEPEGVGALDRFDSYLVDSTTPMWTRPEITDWAQFQHEMERYKVALKRAARQQERGRR